MENKPKYIIKATFNDTKSAKLYDYLIEEGIASSIQPNDFGIVESNFASFNFALVRVKEIVPYNEKLLKGGVKYKYIKHIVPNKSLS